MFSGSRVLSLKPQMKCLDWEAFGESCDSVLNFPSWTYQVQFELCVLCQERLAFKASAICCVSKITLLSVY